MNTKFSCSQKQPFCSNKDEQYCLPNNDCSRMITMFLMHCHFSVRQQLNVRDVYMYTPVKKLNACFIWATNYYNTEFNLVKSLMVQACMKTSTCISYSGLHNRAYCCDIGFDIIFRSPTLYYPFVSDFLLNQISYRREQGRIKVGREGGGWLGCSQGPPIFRGPQK